MAANTAILLAGLEEYQKRLLQHLSQLEQEYQQLERRWQAFSAVYEGTAAEQFRAGWQRTVQEFHSYVEQGRSINAILEERITSLREANRAEGSI